MDGYSQVEKARVPFPLSNGRSGGSHYCSYVDASQIGAPDHNRQVWAFSRPRAVNVNQSRPLVRVWPAVVAVGVVLHLAVVLAGCELG